MMDGSGLWTKDVGSVDGWPAGVDQSTHIRDRMTTHLHETYPRPLPSNNPSLRRMDCMAPRPSFLVDAFFEYNERHVLSRNPADYMISIVGDVLRRSRDKMWCRGRGEYAEVSRLGRCRRCHGQPMGAQRRDRKSKGKRDGRGWT